MRNLRALAVALAIAALTLPATGCEWIRGSVTVALPPAERECPTVPPEGTPETPLPPHCEQVPPSGE